MKIDIYFIYTSFFEILKALPLTLVLTFIPLVIGFGIGLLTAFARIYKVKYVYRLLDFYVSFLRGTPILLHIFVIYFGLPLIIDRLSAYWGWSFKSSSIPSLLIVLTAFSITAGAYMSEIIRSGILSVDRGQIEAAYAIGMSTPQALWRIVAPQAIGVILPNLCNIFVGFLHTSSLAFTVSQMELLGKASIVASVSLKFLEAYIAAAFIYWGLTLLAERLTAFLEKKVTIYNRGGVV
ncbi:cysteine ABC transporter permease [Paenibacillus ferrarius]|uniref:Cysteine ABC transporter permease n=1 Tax=Paenibacillus ferrarius TaxID=1469647 RepID=A0A1V4HMC6_9BACL|nr:amino acid ABC transporter permease [Paenibacillus ferrarius]OPH58694.1 cysteine ABC transporter permease [Paenibacillus ferrarius]